MTTIALSRGKNLGAIEGPIVTCREFGLNVTKILARITEKFHLDEQEARKYLAEAPLEIIEYIKLQN